MKQIILVLAFAISISAFGQVPQTYKGPYTIGNNDGEATYAYTESNGERIIDGNFSFVCATENINITGKYLKGKKTGVWTKKQTYSLYNGMPVKKTELKWAKVTESYPFKEITETLTENWLNNKLQGISTSIKNVKNSWGYPEPGSSSSAAFIVKKTYNEDNLIAIEANRKKNEKINLSFKGAYQNDVADGNWQFSDGTNLFTYNFKNGYLTNYDIKQQGTGKVIEGSKMEVDTVLINSFNSKTDNSFEVKYGSSYSEWKNAKLFIQKVNENLNIVKVCYQQKDAANFKGLDIRAFTNAFGDDITPYKIGDQVLAHSSNIVCEVNNAEKNLFYKINFMSRLKEYQFLNLVNSKDGKFLNTDWKKLDQGTYIYQLKSFIYANNTTELKKIGELQDHGYGLNFENICYEKGMNDIAYFDFWKMLKFVLLKDTIQWKSICDQYYNSTVDQTTWQKYVIAQFDELKATSFELSSVNDVINYLTSKDDEIKKLNEEFISTIKEVTIGNQIWMSADLNIIPFNNSNYKIVKGNEIQTAKIGKGIILYNINILNKNICPKGWRVPTKIDFDQLVKSLGGDLKAAYGMMGVGKGSGFETKFPIITYSDMNYKTFYRENYYKSYLYYDTDKKSMGSFNFDSPVYYFDKSYLPCRCIKE